MASSVATTDPLAIDFTGRCLAEGSVRCCFARSVEQEPARAAWHSASCCRVRPAPEQASQPGWSSTTAAANTGPNRLHLVPLHPHRRRPGPAGSSPSMSEFSWTPPLMTTTTSAARLLVLLWGASQTATDGSARWPMELIGHQLSDGGVHRRESRGVISTINGVSDSGSSTVAAGSDSAEPRPEADSSTIAT